MTVFFRKYKEIKEFKVNVFNAYHLVEINIILKEYVDLKKLKEDISCFFNGEYEIQINTVSTIGAKSNGKKEILEIIED